MRECMYLSIHIYMYAYFCKSIYIYTSIRKCVHTDMCMNFLATAHLQNLSQRVMSMIDMELCTVAQAEGISIVLMASLRPTR